MGVEVVVHEPSEADGPVAHQTVSGHWDPELVPDHRGETRRPEPDCPVEVALRAICGKWATLVVRELMHGPRSFGQLRVELPSLSDKVLTERLSQLQGQGLVDRQEQPGFPTRTVYTLTLAGEHLRPLLIELYRTGQDLQRHMS